MTFWLVTTGVSIGFGWIASRVCQRAWLAVAIAALLGALLAPWLGLRFVWDVTGHRDAQNGLAFLIGPLVSVPVACIAAYGFLRWRRSRALMSRATG